MPKRRTTAHIRQSLMEPAHYVLMRHVRGKPDSAPDRQYLQILRIVWTAAIYIQYRRSTLQYGEYRPAAASRPLICIESLMGLVGFVPAFAAFGWLYCQNRLWSKSMESESLPDKLQLTSDPIVGGWREVENERTKREEEERSKRIRIVPCIRCGSSTARIFKIYDIIGRATPLALFVARCDCGQTSKPSTTAFLAAWRWTRINRNNPGTAHQ